MVKVTLHKSKRSLAMLILLLLPLLSTAGRAQPALPNVDMDLGVTRTYFLEVTFSLENTTTHFYGLQSIHLYPTGPDLLTGVTLWNLTWDEGLTWKTENLTLTFTSSNRTYQWEGLSLHTAWWIPPSTRLGDLVIIDGDAPATNRFARFSPFLVEDRVSLFLGGVYYSCWLLTYQSTLGQRESFYYERATGALIAAYSELRHGEARLHQVTLELCSSNPPIPVQDPLTHLWEAYSHIAIPAILAAAATTLSYLLLRRLQERRAHNWIEWALKRKG